MNRMGKLTWATCLFCLFVFSTNFAWADEKNDLLNILKKVDAVVCSSPKKLSDYYSPKITIISDDHRILLKDRIKDYESMISDLENMKCKNERTILAGNVGSNVGFLLVDEMINVSSRLSSDERQHSVCTYGFVKNGGSWKINHEHCSSLPDYTIVPGDDALYYFHNPVY